MFNLVIAFPIIFFIYLESINPNKMRNPPFMFNKKRIRIQIIEVSLNYKKLIKATHYTLFFNVWWKQ